MRCCRLLQHPSVCHLGLRSHKHVAHGTKRCVYVLRVCMTALDSQSTKVQLPKCSLCVLSAEHKTAPGCPLTGRLIFARSTLLGMIIPKVSPSIPSSSPTLPSKKSRTTVLESPSGIASNASGVFHSFPAAHSRA